MIIKTKKLHKDAIIPLYSTNFSAGADLFCLSEKDIIIPPFNTAFVHTGISIEIPDGYVGLIYARSGLACKNGLAPANKVGVIDSDYRGEIMVALFNHSDTSQKISNGQRIAQLVITPVVKANFEGAEELTQTTRGEGGFGSSGT